MDRLPPITPGELLREEFLLPMGITQHSLAKDIQIPAQHIDEIVNGTRPISPEIDAKLCGYFGLSRGYWLRAQG